LCLEWCAKDGDNDGADVVSWLNARTEASMEFLGYLDRRVCERLNDWFCDDVRFRVNRSAPGRYSVVAEADDLISLCFAELALEYGRTVAE
jgi:hypothetical protein